MNAGAGQDHDSSGASRPALSPRLQDEVPDIAVAKVLFYTAPDKSFHKIRQPGHRGFEIQLGCNNHYSWRGRGI